MRRLRLWIFGAALGSFVAGMNVGFAAPRLFASTREATPDDAYIQSMTADYGLSPEQQRFLRFAMQKWREDELAVMRTIETSQLPAPIQGRLLRVRGQLDQRIRAILDERQRERYDRATRQSPTGPAGR